MARSRRHTCIGPRNRQGLCGPGPSPAAEALSLRLRFGPVRPPPHTRQARLGACREATMRARGARIACCGGCEISRCRGYGAARWMSTPQAACATGRVTARLTDPGGDLAVQGTSDLAQLNEKHPRPASTYAHTRRLALCPVVVFRVWSTGCNLVGLGVPLLIPLRGRARGQLCLTPGHETEKHFEADTAGLATGAACQVHESTSLVLFGGEVIRAFNHVTTL